MRKYISVLHCLRGREPPTLTQQLEAHGCRHHKTVRIFSAMSSQEASREDSNVHYHTGTTGAKITVNEVKLKGRGDLSLACDWGVGIGGGLWSTGLLLIEHLCTHAALYDEALRDRRVLELGSGTGLVGLAAARFGPPREVVITDLESHLDMCRSNVDRNAASTATNQDCCKVIRVEKYDWSGEVPAQLGVVPFDIILGTDVAYYEHLYDPFIRALDRTAGPNTLILLGVTRTDTGPAFFDALDKAGFEYNLVEQASHKGFGLFSVFRERQEDQLSQPLH